MKLKFHKVEPGLYVSECGDWRIWKHGSQWRVKLRTSAMSENYDRLTECKAHAQAIEDGDPNWKS